jgi:hypothetical protein
MRQSAWRIYLLSGPKSSVWLVILALAVSTIPVIAHSQAKPEVHAQARPLSLDEIVTHMEQERLRNKQTPPFLLTRQYQMFHGEEQTPASQVKAQISVVPPSERDYKIIETEGSDRGEKVVRKILDHEAAAEKLNPSPTAIVRGNYDFTDQGRQMFEGVNCYVLGLKPKREEPSLIEGKAWIDPNTFAVRKIEGRMAKSPSWWVKDVDLVVNFGEVGGLWMQTASHAVADVRVIGRYTVQGRVLDVQTATSEAANIPPKRSERRSRAAIPATLLYGTAGRR